MYSVKIYNRISVRFTSISTGDTYVCGYNIVSGIIFLSKSVKIPNSMNESRNFSRDTNFLICKSCFWCASYLYGPCEAVENCPVCCNDRSNCCIESLPIYKETFKHNQLGDTLDVLRSLLRISPEDRKFMLRSRRVYLY